MDDINNNLLVANTFTDIQIETCSVSDNKISDDKGINVNGAFDVSNSKFVFPNINFNMKFE